MAFGHGKDGALQISADGVTYTTIGSTDDFSIDPTNDIAEAKPQLAESVTRARGHSSWSLSATYTKDPADAGQDILKTAFASDTPYYFRVRPIVGSGLDQWYGQFVLQNTPVRSTNTDFNKGTISALSTGAITHDDQ